MKFSTFQPSKLIIIEPIIEIPSFLFLSDRGDQNIKSQELWGPKCSPNLNKIAKTKKGGKSAPPPKANRVNWITKNF